jgi:hypothetical protein
VTAVVLHGEDRSSGDQALVEGGPEVVGVDLSDQKALDPSRAAAAADHATQHEGAGRLALPVLRGEQREPFGEIEAVPRAEPGQLAQRARDGHPPAVISHELEAGEPTTGGEIGGERRAGRDGLEGGVQHEEALEDRGAEGLAGPVEAGLAVLDEIAGDLPVGKRRHHGRRQDSGADEEEQ